MMRQASRHNNLARRPGWGKHRVTRVLSHALGQQRWEPCLARRASSSQPHRRTVPYRGSTTVWRPGRDHPRVGPRHLLLPPHPARPHRRRAQHVGARPRLVVERQRDRLLPDGPRPGGAWQRRRGLGWRRRGRGGDCGARGPDPGARGRAAACVVLGGRLVPAVGRADVDVRACNRPGNRCVVAAVCCAVAVRARVRALAVVHA